MALGHPARMERRHPRAGARPFARHARVALRPGKPPLSVHFRAPAGRASPAPAGSTRQEPLAARAKKRPHHPGTGPCGKRPRLYFPATARKPDTAGALPSAGSGAAKPLPERQLPRPGPIRGKPGTLAGGGCARGRLVRRQPSAPAHKPEKPALEKPAPLRHRRLVR